MKNLKDLTEQEILNLSKEEIDKMIKFRMAEEGIKFIDYPENPEYHEVQKPTTKAYFCHLLGQKLSFTDMEELNNVIDVLNNCKSLCTIDSNYDLPEGHKNFIKARVENANWSSDAPDTITPIIAYAHNEFLQIKELLKENAKNKTEFNAKVKEYDAAINDAQWIKDEVMERINEVVSKYDKLNTYIYRFNNEYLPLADNNEDIAMNFLDKAYSLNKEQKEYVLANYKNS